MTSQLRHTLLSVLGALPLSHLRQASPLADTRPLPQFAQLVFCAFGALPGSQLSHVPLAPASPSSQLTHAVLLVLSGLSLLPAAQSTHAFFVELKYDGYAHGTQADLVGLGCLAPVHATHLAPVGDTLPSVHVAQSLALALGCLPPPHGLHRPLLPAKPVGHAPHAVRLSLGVLPAAHLTHVAPSELYLPCLAVTSQLRHTLLGVFGALPAAQASHVSPG